MTQADAVGQSELIQPLWNNYGTLSRVHLEGGAYTSVIVKHIKIPSQVAHPRGFTSDISRDRKIRSYEVETHWYGHQNRRMPETAPTPKCLDAFAEAGELFLVLEDLAQRGFIEALYGVGWAEIAVVLRWLARFHAQFLGDVAEGLWSCGTYWHLATRPEELANIEGTRLHRFASLLDARLRCGAHPTLVHGDAKLANFLFTDDHSEVAAVDFQYVGRGAAMKDVAYFVGSCLGGAECDRREDEVLALYFSELQTCLPSEVDGAALETEWRALYPVAWADFQRFMLGWSPGHRKLTDYSDETTSRAIQAITRELMAAARAACLAAGQFIQANREKPLEVTSKGFASRASDVVTAIDLEAQAIICDRLAPTLERYDLGMLAEEGLHDDSRLQKHAFWTIDPLDGTRYFIEGEPGYAVSIALVSRAGHPILGVVYDPVSEDVYEAVAGEGVRLNGVSLERPESTPERHSDRPVWYADRSLESHPRFADYQARFDIRFAGGAVINSLRVLMDPEGVYIKAPKKALGGCAIWDLAAVALMLAEGGGIVRAYDGSPLSLNRPEGVFFNDVGLILAGSSAAFDSVFAHLPAHSFDEN